MGLINLMLLYTIHIISNFLAILFKQIQDFLILLKNKVNLFVILSCLKAKFIKIKYFFIPLFI
jgi:hypothetical protein